MYIYGFLCKRFFWDFRLISHIFFGEKNITTLVLPGDKKKRHLENVEGEISERSS